MPANLLAFPREITSLGYSAIARSSFSVLSNSFLGIFIEVNTASGTINFIMYTTVMIAVTWVHIYSLNLTRIYIYINPPHLSTLSPRASPLYFKSFHPCTFQSPAFFLIFVNLIVFSILHYNCPYILRKYLHAVFRHPHLHSIWRHDQRYINYMTFGYMNCSGKLN